MAKAKFKLIPQEDEWSVDGGGDTLICPVCFTPIHPRYKEDHTQWHQNLADIFKLLGGWRGPARTR